MGYKISKENCKIFRSFHFPINGRINGNTWAVLSSLLLHLLDYFFLRAEFLNWNTMHDLSRSIKINWPLVLPAQDILKYLCLEHPKYLSIFIRWMSNTHPLFHLSSSKHGHLSAAVSECLSPRGLLFSLIQESHTAQKAPWATSQILIKTCDGHWRATHVHQNDNHTHPHENL